jgi:hypothetical protein
MVDAEMSEELLDLFDPATFLLDTDNSSSSDSNSPPLITDDSTPDSSPPHWSQSILDADLLPLPEISIDVYLNSLSQLYFSH